MSNYIQEYFASVPNLARELQSIDSGWGELKFVAVQRADLSRVLIFFDVGTKHSFQAAIETARHEAKFIAAGAVRSRSKKVSASIDSDSCRQTYGFEGPRDPQEQENLLESVRGYFQKLIEENA